MAFDLGIYLSINEIPLQGYTRLANFVNLLDLEYVANHFGYLVVVLTRSLGRIMPLLSNVMLQATLGLAMLLLLTACSPEPRWVSVPNGKAGEFIDISSLATAGPVRRVSIKIVFTTPQSGDTSQGNRRVVQIVVRQAFDCAENKQRTEAMTFHYANGVVFDVPADQLPSPDWKPVEPDDGKPELDFTCGQRMTSLRSANWF